MNAPRQVAATRLHRSGIVLLATIVCLAAVMMFFGAWVRVAVAERKQLHSIEDRVQAEYLAASGVRRARARLNVEPAYQGETWQLECEALGGRTGVAQIEIKTDGPSNERVIRVTAQVPADAINRATHTTQITIHGSDPQP
jgi:hypothetical protein